jgi:hypothetical protein
LEALGQPRVATRCSLSRDEFIWMRIQNLKSMSFNCINFEPDFFEVKEFAKYRPEAQSADEFCYYRCA